MRGVFDQNLEELPLAERRRDRELTLGPMVLLGGFFGLLLLCGLCFGVGYTLGNRNAQAAPAAQQPGVPAPSSVDNAQSKPTAAAPGVSQPQDSANSAAQSAVSSALPDTTGNSDATAASAASPTQPTVKPALPELQTPVSGQPAVLNPAPAINSAQILPAPAMPAAAFMVQIATVTQQQDAEALVGALRQRGYAVIVRRDPPQGAFHVEIGPFTRRTEAIATRQKLLNDGYNASLQP